MPSIKKQLKECPEIIRQGIGENEILWHLEPTLVARPDEEVAELFHFIKTDEAVEGCYPVYRQQPSTAPAVATGQLFLRLQDNLVFKMFEARLTSLGLRVSETLKWAPNAAWISAVDKNPCHALRRITDLKTFSDVAHVEAQLLIQLKHR